jgi:hypothetical protein
MPVEIQVCCRFEVNAAPNSSAVAVANLIAVRRDAIYSCGYNECARRRMFDAQCDLAAIVYTLRDDPDRLLLDFVDDLRRAGCRPLGFVQLGRVPSSDAHTIRLLRLPSGDVVSLRHDPASDAHQCGLETERLVDTAGAIAAGLGDSADLVVINRFGKLEAKGKGLIDLIRRAGEADIPVLIAVPEHRFETWTRYSCGMSVRITCNRRALDRWWQSVSGGAIRATAAPTLCAIAK